MALRGWCSLCQTVSSEFFALFPKNQILTYTCTVHVFERSITQSTGLDDWRCLVTSYIEVKFQFKPEPHTSTCTLLLHVYCGIDEIKVWFTFTFIHVATCACMWVVSLFFMIHLLIYSQNFSSGFYICTHCISMTPSSTAKQFLDACCT